MPISAQTTVGIKDRVPKDLAPWYDGPALLEYLDNMNALERKVNAPFMMPIAAKYRDLGTMVEGKIESGVIRKDAKYLMMPNRETISIAALYGETEEEIQCVHPYSLAANSASDQVLEPRRAENKSVSAFEALKKKISCPVSSSAP